MLARTNELSIKAEEAIRLLSVHVPPSDENSRKPVLFHSVRVGVYLYENGYPQDVVLAGFLHDTVEGWTTATEQIVREAFGGDVMRLILASTKDYSITDSIERTNELIKRCVQNGEDALVVKIADTIDSFKWYSAQNNKDELQVCAKTADAIFRFKPDNFNDKIFEELKRWQNVVRQEV